MYDPISLGIKFVKAGQSDVPGSNAIQTGDWMMILVFAFLALAAVGFAGYLIWRNKISIKASSQLNSSLSFVASNGALIKAGIIVSIAISAICLVFACFSARAFAANEASPLTPDKSEVTATVSDDGTFTLDTCVLTNISSTDKFTVESSKVALTDAVKNVEGIDATNIEIAGFGGTVYSGQPSGTGSYTPTDISPLEAGGNTTLQFNINFIDESIIKQLIDKQVFNISLTPEKKEDLVKIQFKNVETDKGTFDYCPVFNEMPAGVTFYGDDGTSYSQMNENISYAMALKGATINTVRCIPNLSWNDIYVSPGEVGEATELQETFKSSNLVKNEDSYIEWVKPVKDEGPDPKWEYNVPIVYGANLLDVWTAYNPTHSSTGFGGEDCWFLSPVKISNLWAHSFLLNVIPTWQNRSIDSRNNYVYILIGRTFTA